MYNDKKMVIWGTGEISRSFSESLDELTKIEFYIDNNIANCGKVFYEKKVFHPSQLASLSEYFIIIANSFYDEIKVQLEQEGLRENSDFIYYGKVENCTKKAQRLLDELKAVEDSFENDLSEYIGRPLIFGSMVSFDPNACINLNRIYKALPNNKKFLHISETKAISDREAEGNVEFPFYKLPLILWQNFHLTESKLFKLEINDEIKNYVDSAEYRKNAAVNFKDKNEDIAEGYEYLFVYYADNFLKKLFGYIRPECVIMWNSFYPFHMLIRENSKQMGIKNIYMEFGVLPGTYAIERQGQMGESFPAVEAKKFSELYISEAELNEAKKVKEYLFDSRLNRKTQPQNTELNLAMEKMQAGRPIVLFSGQNDYESGMNPYTDNTKKFHSPIFKSSFEAAYFLAEICKKNNWNYIYKPHPLCLNKRLKNYGLPENAVIIEKCDIHDLIDMVDVNITILSQMGYVSLIRKKATLMLGYIQLKDKDCTYQAFEKEQIEDTIKKAIQYGYTMKQDMAFIKHIAQLLKYYLYDDMGNREIRYGRDLIEIIKE